MALTLTTEQNFDPSIFQNASCAFGVFDGIHKGHQFLLQKAIETAKQCKGRSIALTFDIDPDEMFHPKRLKKLMSNKDRLEGLAQSGVDDAIAFHFTRDFADKAPLDFLRTAFSGYVPAFVHVGDNFRFGSRDAGSVSDLRAWGESVGCKAVAHHLVSTDGKPISATRIRLLLADGHVEDAKDLLGHPYTIHQRIQHGRGEGADLGFRTANLFVEPMMKPISDGVYAAYARIGNKKYRAAVSVGVSPTFASSATANCEVHILNFNEDIYGRDIYVDFVHWLRPMKKFDSEQELVSTVNSNIAWVQTHLPL